MRAIDIGPAKRDPLAHLRGVLLAVLLAFLLSTFVAALIASHVPGSYMVRANAYLVLIVWTLTGSALLFRGAFQSEARPLGVRRLAVWVISIWLWPLLLSGRRRPAEY
jgi:hypothetical protein